MWVELCTSCPSEGSESSIVIYLVKFKNVYASLPTVSRPFSMGFWLLTPHNNLIPSSISPGDVFTLVELSCIKYEESSGLLSLALIFS